MKNKAIATVSELTERIKDQLQGSFDKIWVKGEISNFVRHFSGHMYLTIKDSRAQIRAVIFAGVNKHLPFELKNGMNVIVWGNVTVYEKSGLYQILVMHIEPQGIGSLRLAFDQLKQKLDDEGLFKDSHKQKIPLYPQKIGVITSVVGAALGDILHVLARRYPIADVIIISVPVQGKGSEMKIVSALELASRVSFFDVLILARGGGSIEDLDSFNKEILARAIHRCGIPMISAVGHEMDFTISDFVADKRAPTPSAGAEIAVPNRVDIQKDLNHSDLRLCQALFKKIKYLKTLFVLLERNSVFQNAHQLLIDFQKQCLYKEEKHINLMKKQMDQKKQLLLTYEIKINLFNLLEKKKLFEQQLKERQKRLFSLMKWRISQSLDSMKHKAMQMNAVSPMNVLSRGYALVFDEKNKNMIKSESQLSLGMLVKVKIANGAFYSRIERLEGGEKHNG